MKVPKAVLFEKHRLLSSRTTFPRDIVKTLNSILFDGNLAFSVQI